MDKDMPLSIDTRILTKIKKARRGALFFSSDFAAFGKPNAIRQALHRLVKSGEIDRVTTGIFVRLQYDNVVGKIIPDIEDIVKSIAKNLRIWAALIMQNLSRNIYELFHPETFFRFGKMTTKK
jgi:hypothetical protein